MIRKVLVLTAVLVLGTMTAYAKKGGPDCGDNPCKGSDHPGMGMDMGGMNHDMMQGMMVFAKLSGIHPIMEKYNIQIQKVFLETKEKNLGLHTRLMELRDALVKLSADYSKDSGKNGKEISKVLKEMVDVQNKIQANREAGMVSIKQLNDQRKKEIDAAIAKWLNVVGSDPVKMQELVDAVNTMKPMGPGKGMKKDSDWGPGKEKGKGK
jgi:hypothetical protein